MCPQINQQVAGGTKGKDRHKNTVSSSGVFIVQCSDGKIDQNHLLITLPESII